MKYDYRDQNDNTVIKARSLDETLKEIVGAVNSIGLRMPMDDKEMVASVLRIAEVIEDYRVENIHDGEQSDNSLFHKGIVTINNDQRKLPPPTRKYAILGAIYGHNECCKDKPFLLCANKRPSDGGINYSCECYCGMFCTNGHDNLLDAIAEYESLKDHRMDGDENG